MKLSSTNVKDTAEICQDYFDLDVPSVIVGERRITFL